MQCLEVCVVSTIRAWIESVAGWMDVQMGKKNHENQSVLFLFFMKVLKLSL